MKKKMRVVLMTTLALGALAVGAGTAAVQTAAPVAAAGWSYPVAVVKGQSATLYDSNGGGLRADRPLAKNSAWRVFGQATYGGHTYYKVSNTGWVAANAVSRTGNGTVPTVKPVATVMTDSGALLFEKDPTKELTSSGRTLPKNSRWIVLDAKKGSDGTVWFNVGGWIKAINTRIDGIVPIQNASTAPIDTTPVATMKVSAQGYGMTADHHTYQTGSTLNAGSRWKVLIVTTDPQGVRWYLIGNNVWINSNQATIVNADKAKQENYAWPTGNGGNTSNNGSNSNSGSNSNGSTNGGSNTTNGGTTVPNAGSQTDPPVSQKVDYGKYSYSEYKRLVNRQIASLDLNQVNTDFMALINGRRAKAGLAPYQNDPRAQKLAQKLAELDTVGQFWSEKEWKQWATDLGFKNVRHVYTGIGSYSGQYVKYNWGDPQSVSQFEYWTVFQQSLLEPEAAFTNFKYGGTAIAWNEAGGALEKNADAYVRLVAVDAD